MMKKNYSAPALNVFLFAPSDIVRTSCPETTDPFTTTYSVDPGCSPDGGENPIS